MELTIASLLATPTLAATLGAWVGSAAERTRWAGPGLKDGFTLAELGFDQRQNFGGFYAGELIAFAQMGPPRLPAPIQSDYPPAVARQRPRPVVATTTDGHLPRCHLWP